MIHTGNMLETRDYLNAIKIAGDLEHCRDIEDFRTTTLANSLEYIGAETSVFFLVSTEQKAPLLSRGKTLGSTTDVMYKYVDTYSSMDPVMDHVTQVSPPQYTDVFRLEDIVDYRLLVDSQYYQEFLLPGGVHHLLAIKLATRTSHAGLMGLHRSRSGKPFTPMELEKAKLIAPLLAMALERMLFMDDVEKTNSILSILESEFRSKAVIVLDPNFLPIYKTAAVCEYLTKSTGSVNAGLQVLVTSWRRAVMNRAGQNGSLSLTVRTKLGNSLCVARLERQLINTNQEYWLIHLLGVEDDSTELIRGPTMTPRQTEIVKLVAAGLSNKEIASTLEISVKTVENHLYTMYSELGVNNRTMLVHMLGQKSKKLWHS